jgi:branched-chain amino acid transport system substrate-binding protein
MTHKLTPLLATLALVLPAGATAQVKVGFINTMTGAEAPIGENLTNGVEMAVEDLGKAGIKIALVKQDDGGKPDRALRAMEQLVTGDGVAAIVGPYTSGSAAAVAKLAEQHKVPQIIPAAAKEDITRQGYRYVFRLNAPAHQYAQSLLDAALSFGKPKTIAFIYESTDFGSSVAAAGKDYARRKGLQIVADESYEKGAVDYRWEDRRARMAASKPDLVFMVSYVADAIQLMHQSRQVGLKPQAFLGGGAGFDTTQFQEKQDISANVFSVTQWTPEGFPGGIEFAERYRAKYGKKPTYHAACAYSAMMIAGEVASKAGGDREKIRVALGTGSWSGIMGDVKFDDHDGFTNQNQLVMPVIQYQRGKSETVYPPRAAKKKPVYPFPGWN